MLRMVGTGSLVVTVAVAMSGLLVVREASAAALTDKLDTMTRLEDSVDSNHTISFDMSATGGGVAEGETIIVTFPAGFDTSSITEDDVDITEDSVDLTTAVDCTGSEEASVDMTNDVLTITICSGDGGAIDASDTVEIEIGTNATASGTGSNQITNDTSAGTENIAITGSNGDTGNIQVPIIDDDSVHVTATVDESISFAISDVAIGFGDLTSSNVRYATSDATGANADEAAFNLQVGTNASGGYIVSYNGSTLTSGADTIDVAGSIATGGSAGTEQFAMSLENSDDGTVTAAYFHDTPLWTFVADTTTTIITETGPTATETFNVHLLANIAAETEAGSYETDITYIATATF